QGEIVSRAKIARVRKSHDTVATPHKPKRNRKSEGEPSSAQIASVAPIFTSAPARASRPVAPDRNGTAGTGASSSNNTSSNGDGLGSTGTGIGAGEGSGMPGGGAGVVIAHADYGQSPAPIYPASARRREQQGTVILRVLVAADGSVERAEVAESSGIDVLDESALETVRSRWRFIPARRGAITLESWVLVPIQFALTSASASH
ncbi:MAG: periplasmic protein TonB, partial [Candidatus Binatus sp.]|nr:periplasmic protein TonB [Candidatus Binatus sp.]